MVVARAVAVVAVGLDGAFCVGVVSKTTGLDSTLVISTCSTASADSSVETMRYFVLARNSRTTASVMRCSTRYWFVRFSSAGTAITLSPGGSREAVPPTRYPQDERNVATETQRHRERKKILAVWDLKEWLCGSVPKHFSVRSAPLW